MLFLDHNFMSRITASFNGMLKMFIHSFLYRHFSGKSSFPLRFEVANHALAYLTGATIYQDVVPFNANNADTF